MSKNNIGDLIKEFEEKAKTAKSKYEFPKDKDEIYDVDIHIWRHPGMGNSLQTISGNKVSIMTATSSYLNTLLLKELCTEKELDDLVKMVKESYKCTQTKN